MTKRSGMGLGPTCVSSDILIDLIGAVVKLGTASDVLSSLRRPDKRRTDAISQVIVADFTRANHNSPVFRSRFVMNV